jgi:hypothetical protein
MKRPWQVIPKSERNPTMIADADGRRLLHLSGAVGLNDNDLANTIVAAVNSAEEMRQVLAEIVGQEKPNRWGYDAGAVALDAIWRTRARAALQRHS